VVTTKMKSAVEVAMAPGMNKSWTFMCTSTPVGATLPNSFLDPFDLSKAFKPLGGYERNWGPYPARRHSPVEAAASADAEARVSETSLAHLRQNDIKPTVEKSKPRKDKNG